MKRSLLVLLICGVALTVGCSESCVTTKPDANALLGAWVPDERHSTCPKPLISKDTRLLLRQDGTFLAENFPKEVSLGRQPSVKGRWGFKNENGRWNLDLPWEAPSLSVLDGAQLIKSGKEILVEMWIGDPDAYSRLVLRKLANPTPPNKPHAANPAMPLALHAGRHWRGVADGGRWPN